MVRRYTVFVDDNFHYMDKSERYKLGEFDTCEIAIAKCKEVVDEFLETCDPKLGADEMFKQYTTFGEDPWIVSDDAACTFSAWEYARQRCSELAQKAGGKPLK